MPRLLKSVFLPILHKVIILTVSPYVYYELPGWGKIYAVIVGDYTRNWFWKNAPTKTIRGKMHGYLMDLDLTRWSDRCAFFLGRWYSLDIQLLLADLVAPGDTVVDIGANRGMFSLIASQLVGDKGKVISFEPNPVCLEVLDQTIATNQIKNITINRCGLADKKEYLTLTVPLSNWGEGTFGKSRYQNENTYSVKVDVCTGDACSKIYPLHS